MDRPASSRLINIHIPKSAGSALRATLSKAVMTARTDPPFVIGVHYTGDGDYFGGLRNQFVEQLPELFLHERRMLSGHFRYRDIADLLPPFRGNVTVTSFLRDPVRRTLSDYFYSISETHDGRDAFVKTYPTFDHYMQNAGEMNKMTDYLRPHDDATAQETLHAAVQEFEFLGIMENFAPDLNWICQHMGIAPQEPERENVNRNRSAMQEAREKYTDVLQDVLADDYLLYHGVLAHRGLRL